jgi:aminopeptidase N
LSQGYNSAELNDLIGSESKGFYKGEINKGVQQAVNYDLKYHRLEWQINPEVYYVTGAITSYFVPVIAGFNEIYFDCSNSLTIDSIVYNGANLIYTQPVGNVLQITFPTVLQQNVMDSITVYYQGAPVVSLNGFGSFAQGSHNNDSIIWTLSEPYGAMEWWPCKQDLNDKIDSIDIIVTTPQKYRVGSQGLLVNETTVGSNKVYHWKHRYPIATYLISVTITTYAVYTDVAPLNAGNLNVLNYIFPEDSGTFVGITPVIIPMLQLFDTLIGDYPFMNEKYGHAQFTRNGGMEHQTMSSMRGFSFSLMAHELAHQWFGDKVTCGTWSEIWLNEGFATYLTGITHKYIAPTYWYSWREQVLNAIIAEPDGSVFNTDTSSVSRTFDSRLSYNKGAYLLRMLEWKMGEATFFQGVRNYLDDANLAYSYSRTSDLKSHLEAVSGLNLTEYFDDWYFGEGHPSYQVVWGQNGSNATFTVSQTQSDVSVSFYEMPIPIYVKGGGQDTTLVFDHQFSGQVFNATVPFTIDSVFFDPELWIISENSIVLSVNEVVDLDFSVEIYPNPAKESVSVLFNPLNRVEEVIVFDLSGKVVKAAVSQKSSNEIQINTSQLSVGSYILEVHSEQQIIRKKINKI